MLVRWDTRVRPSHFDLPSLTSKIGLDSARRTWLDNLLALQKGPSALVASPRRALALSAITLLSLLAAGDGIYLTLVHIDYLVGFGDANLVCQAFGEAGCSVTAGRFGSFFGVPVSVIGFAGASTVALLALAAFLRRTRPEDPLRAMLLLLAAVSVFASFVMTGLSALEGSFCPLCVAWYFLNAGVFVGAWAARDRDLAVPRAIATALWALGVRAMLLFIIASLGGLLFYWQQLSRRLDERKEAFRQEVPALVAGILGQPREDVLIPAAPRRESAAATSTLAPAIEVVEFGDFQCPHCKTLFVGLERYLDTTERSVAVSFVHFPLDSTCNPGAGDLHPFACDAARAAVCADEQGKFWKFARRLFEHQDHLALPALRQYATETGLVIDRFDVCMESDAAKARVAEDVARGNALSVRVTPTFFVAGHRVEGGFPEDVLALVMERMAVGLAVNE